MKTPMVTAYPKGWPAPTTDADEFVAGMVAAHRAAGSISVQAGLLTPAEARKLAERLIADADAADGRRFEVVNEAMEWDPQP